MTVNKPSNSKINWTAALVAILNILFLLLPLPAAILPHLIVLVNIFGLSAIGVMRTWFTEKVKK